MKEIRPKESCRVLKHLEFGREQKQMKDMEIKS